MIPGKKIPLLLLISIALFVSSCASPPPAPAPEPQPVQAPEPVPEPPPPPPPEPEYPQAELDALLAEAMALRKDAFDLGLAELMAADYKAATDVLNEGKTAHEAKDAPKARASLEKAIGLFKDLIARGVVDLAAKKRAKAIDLKTAAQKIGADGEIPARFEPAEKDLAEGDALVASGKHREAIAVFERARLTFELAWRRGTASQLRKKIADADYAKWDSGNFQLAENKFAEEDRLFGASGAVAEGVTALSEAVQRYELVFEKGRVSYASSRKSRTEELKARAMSIKANVAVKEAFQAALAMYEKGVAQLAAKEFEAATATFDEASTAFDTTYATAAEKRAKAEEAMKAAASAAAQSEQKAKEADSIVNASIDD